jgi:hypothetical protein
VAGRQAPNAGVGEAFEPDKPVVLRFRPVRHGHQSRHNRKSILRTIAAHDTSCCPIARPDGFLVRPCGACWPGWAAAVKFPRPWERF